MKYYRKCVGAPPTVIIAGKGVGSVPLPVEDNVARKESVNILRLLRNGWIEEVFEARIVEVAPVEEPTVDDPIVPPEWEGSNYVEPEAPEPPAADEAEPEEDPMDLGGPGDTLEDGDNEEPMVDAEVTTTEADATADYDLSKVDFSVAKLREFIGQLEDVGYVIALLDAEGSKEKPRVSAISALEERIAELKG
ncbi:MAG: hypothetical protein ABH877_04860 [bacterium]